VLAFGCGSVLEIIEDGLTGRIVSDLGAAIIAVPELLALDRRAIRARFEQRFSSARMATNYLKIYHKMLRKHEVPQLHLSRLAAPSATVDGRAVEGS
jgi:glycosyltransferase involved in cell wall biosynthesis